MQRKSQMFFRIFALLCVCFVSVHAMESIENNSILTPLGRSIINRIIKRKESHQVTNEERKSLEGPNWYNGRTGRGLGIARVEKSVTSGHGPNWYNGRTGREERVKRHNKLRYRNLFQGLFELEKKI